MPLVLDHVESIELSDEERQHHFNELKSLDYLAGGLRWLATNVRMVEQRYLEQEDPKMFAFAFGNVPGKEWVPWGMLACAFHWYAVSSCNYARLVGWLGNDGDSPKATDYFKSVLPNVHVWRNKVAAHFAVTDPHDEDTPADLAASVLFPIGFQDDSFVASPFTLAKGDPSGSSSSREDMTWSLTHVHAQLCQRFWPQENTD